MAESRFHGWMNRAAWFFWLVLNRAAATLGISAGEDATGARLRVGDRVVCRCCNSVAYAELRHRYDGYGFSFEGSGWERTPLESADHA